MAAIPDSGVKVEFDEGEAELQIRNHCALDAFTVPNSADQSHPLGHPVAAVLHNFTMRWKGMSRRINGFQSTPPADDKFAGDFIENSCTIEVDVTTLPSTGHGFHFVSDPNSTMSNFAQIGRERNGAFA